MCIANDILNAPVEKDKVFSTGRVDCIVMICYKLYGYNPQRHGHFSQQG